MVKLPGLSFDSSQETVLIGASLVAHFDFLLKVRRVELREPARLHEAIYEFTAVSVQAFLAFMHVAESLELLPFFVLFRLRIDLLDVNPLHSERCQRTLIAANQHFLVCFVQIG